MSVRLIEISIDKERAERIADLVAEQQCVRTTFLPIADDRTLIHLTLPTEQSEALLDELESILGNNGEAHAVVLPVELAWPRFEEADRKPDNGENASGPATDNGAKARGRTISREELYQDLEATTRLNGVYLTMVALSAIVAAIGLMTDSVAVIVGAMVLAPLLGPNIALALATTLADLKLGRKAIAMTGAGLAAALLVTLPIGFYFEVDPEATEIAARSSAGLGDIVLALASGAAGALAFTSGAPGSLIGVMVAVALLPPLSVFALLLGAGHIAEAIGAANLLAINVVCVNLAAVSTFRIQGVVPRHWWKAERARKASWIAIALWAALLAALAGLLMLARSETFQEDAAETLSEIAP